MSKEVKELVHRLKPNLSLAEYGRIYTDTTAYMDIYYGDIIEIDGLHYLVLRDEVERSFGIEDPKYWVKRCILLETGERRILKLVFHEKFMLKLGTLEIPCYRSPEKEARILDLVRGDMRFMQGFSRFDKKGNVVRIIEIVMGRRLDHCVFDIEASHRDYFYDHLPGILEKFMDSCSAIKFLHDHDEIHGDIRRDHLWEEHGTGRYRWIDFDYTYEFEESPFGLDIFGLGRLPIYLVGHQISTTSNLASQGFPPETANLLDHGDFSLLYRNRIVNLKKLFPYIPARLNMVLMHFSNAAEVFYDTVNEFMEDLEPCIGEIKNNRT